MQALVAMVAASGEITTLHTLDVPSTIRVRGLARPARDTMTTPPSQA